MSVEVKQISATSPISPQNLIVVAGVTASGKTAYAKKLAARLLNEAKLPVFINVDSMQVYTELTVGNNKGELVYRQGSNPISGNWFYADLPEIPVKLVNIVSVYSPEASNLNVSAFQKLARQEIGKSFADGKVPILVGGSGLYLAAVICDYEFLQDRMIDSEESAEKPHASVDELQQQLSKLGFDLNILNNSDRANPRRLQNLLRKMQSGIEIASSQPKFIYNIELHYLQASFPAHKKMLSKRVVEMLPGLITECEQLLAHYGKTESIPAKLAAASGYKQVLEALAASTNISSPATLIKLADLVSNSHYQLARRQDKWFKKYLLRP
jgi:tRNA dimethylallyltransferase